MGENFLRRSLFVFALAICFSLLSILCIAAVHNLYSDFGMPERGFLFSNGTGLVSVNDTLVYSKGYYSVNGSSWVSFNLSGSFYNSDVNWLNNFWSVHIPTFGNGEHYVIVYSCSFVSPNTSWDCHENRWQLIILNNSESSNSTCSDNCTSLGFECGTHNICGVNTICGSYGGGCPAGQSCSPNSTCICVPATCASLGRNCGTVSDGCGNMLTCGSYGGGCQSGYNCSSSGVCVVSGCVDSSIKQNFEGVFPPSGWGTGGNSNWVKATSNTIDGSAAAESGTVSHSMKSWMNYTGTFSEDGYVWFNWKVSSESNYDYLCFCKDKTCGSAGCRCVDSSGSGSPSMGAGEADASITSSSDGVWTSRFVNQSYTAGTHTFTWCYATDVGVIQGENKGIVDNVVFFPKSSCYVCVPATCASLGRNCGTVSDGCGGVLTCGSYGGGCQSGYSCSPSGTCVVSAASCGDGECNGDETCSTCSSDCGSCPAGTVYYISPTGSDTSGTGTSSSPWKTLYKACNSVSAAGSTIYVNPGTYTETQQCVLKTGVSIMGAGDSSVITSTTITSEWNPIVKMHSSSSTNGDQTISYIKFDGSNRVASQAIDIRGRNNVKIHHCTFTNFKYVGIGWTTATATMQSPYVTGSEFYNNTVINCAGYPDDWQRGALLLGGQDGMLIHHNYMVENSSSNQGLPIKFWYWDGDSKGVKIYNNFLKKTNFAGWDFAIESNYEQGMEVYNNRIVGALDLNYQIKGNYDYSVYVHDNVIGPDGPISEWHGQAAGVILEFSSEAVIVERNLIVNASPCFLFTPRDGDIDGVTIRYNICKDIQTSGYYNEGLRIVEPSNIQISRFYMYNNILHGYSASSLGNGISISTGGAGYTGSDMQFINNIIMNFGNGAPITFSTSSINGLYIQNNVFYNNGNNNQPRLTGTPTNYVNSGNVVSNPLFVGLSTGNYNLQSSSPAINSGKNLGITTDFANNTVPVGSAPDIGALESNY